ncbi:MAG: PorT family protein, partial [Saprospiraceae bacterium]|nr:PorT family protein [Saprospiraceae bacterium]
GELPDLPAQAIPLPKFQTRWSMGILAGPRLALPVWPFRTATPGWHAGLYVQADLSPRWSIRTELAVKTLDNELERESSDVLYDDFGASVKVDQSVYTNGLLFVELPVLAVRRMGRHEWFGGPRLTWVNVRDDVSSVATKGSAFTEVNYLEIRDGIRKTDLGLVLGYGYRLHQRWAVDVRYNQGLFDLTYDDFFNNTRTLLNSDLQFSLRYAF